MNPIVRRCTTLLTITTLALGLAACGDGDDGGDDDAAEGGDWTVLSYSIADTDLEPFMIQDVAEMGEVGSGDNLDIVALVDRAADYSEDSVLGIPDWHGGKLLHISQGSAEVLEEMGDVNTGDPKVLSDFIARGFADYPSRNYALVISDHGASWPGVGGDESSDHDTLGLAEIHDAIAAGLEEAGVEKLDLLGFDACLMSTYEVASTMAPLAERMIASQELEPGHGWDYNALSSVADNPDATVDDLGAALVDGFAGQARTEGTESSITLALIDLNKMEAVDEALAAFTASLAQRGTDVAPVVGRTVASNLGFGRSPDPTEDTNMTDLGLLASAIGIDALDVSDDADALVKAINDAVVKSVDGAATNGASGLSIYFPQSKDHLSEDYANVESARAWASFLDSYYAAGEAIPEDDQPEFTEDRATTSFDADGVNISGTFDLAAAGNVTAATISYAVVDPDGSLTYLGEEPADIAEDDSGEVVASYDLTALTISDGEDAATAYVTLDWPDDAEVATIDIPMAYYAADDVDGETYQDVLLTLSFDPESGDIVDETYYAYDDETGMYGELTADPEGIIVPEVLTIGTDGTEEWTATSDVGIFADLPNLEYDFARLDPGTELHLELSVYDYGDNSDTITAQVKVP